MIFIATLGGLVTLIFWGAGDYFVGKSGQKGNIYLTNFVIQCLGLAIFLPIALAYGFSLPAIPLLALMALIAALFTVAFLSFIKALAIGPFGVAAPIGNSSALITILVGMAFLGFEISVPKLLSCIVIIIGVVLLAVDRSTVRGKIRHSTVYFAVIAMLLWGAGFALSDIVMKEMRWYEFLFWLNLFLAVYGLIAYRVIYRSFPRLKDMHYRSSQDAWHGGLLLIVGGTAFFMTTEYAGSVVIPAVVGSAAPLVTSLLAYIRDNEHIPLIKRAGAFVVVGGLVLLNIF